MKQVILSGKINDVYDMTHDVILAQLIEEETKDIFYCFWDNNRFQNLDEELLKKRVVISGKLEYIKIRIEGRENTRRILAVFVEFMEFYEVDK